ncbi:MAG TPA: hypothetical protein VGN08_01975 [Solirubrobacteraceae bacterium]|jgi:hypothetical protein
MPHYDLTVKGARDNWTQIRWALFVFPDIVDVAPADDPAVVRIFYEGTRPYPGVWRVELLQAGFDVPALERPAAERARPGAGSNPAGRRPRSGLHAGYARGRHWSGAPMTVARERARQLG